MQPATGDLDLADPDLLVVLCADTVPCGKGAATILTNAAITLTPVSLEEKVKGVVTKVQVGEVDAGITRLRHPWELEGLVGRIGASDRYLHGSETYRGPTPVRSTGCWCGWISR